MDLRSSSFGILGAGRLGSALAEALSRAGYRIAAISSRTDVAAHSLAERIGASAVPAGELVASVDAVILAVPDDAVVDVCRSFAWRAGQCLVHTSGALGLDALAAASARGALTGCLHPLQSFPERSGGAERFRGIACGVEGDGALSVALARVCVDLGASSFSLVGVDRARYHAAAVIASNYVVALQVAAARAWTLAGLPADRAREALAPLTRGAAENIERLPLHEALTGPVARGDVHTLARHLAALAEAPELAELYRRLAATLLSLDLALGAAERAALERLVSPARDSG